MTPSPRPSLLMAGAGFALLLPRLASADDDETNASCVDVRDRPSFQRALSTGCTTISLGGDFPAMTRAIAIAIELDEPLILEAGPWSIPPLDIGEGTAVTIRDGRAEARRAVRREGAFFPSILDLAQGASLTLTNPTIADTPDSTDVHAVVRQDTSAGGRVEIAGARTEGALDHILLLQRTDLAEGDACRLDADAEIRASAEGPTELTLAPGGVIVGALYTSGGELQGTYTTAVSANLSLLRLRLDGEAAGLFTTLEGVEVDFAPITTPAAVDIQESLWIDLDLSTSPVVRSPSEVRLSSFLAADARLDGQSLVSAPVMGMDQAVVCGLSGTGSLLAPLGSEPAFAAIQRSALHSMELPLLASAVPSSALDLDNLTLVRASDDGELDLLDGEGTVLLRNSYVEGAWRLPSSMGTQAVRTAELSCPEGADGCEELSESSIQPGARECAEVLDAWFSRKDTLASWPRAMRELDRLVELQSTEETLVGEATDATNGWGCSDPPKLGAWPGADCGLNLLAYDLPYSDGDGDSTADGAGDTGALDADEPEEAAPTPQNVYGCQGRGALSALFVGSLLPGWLRRRSRRRAAPPARET